MAYRALFLSAILITALFALGATPPLIPPSQLLPPIPAAPPRVFLNTHSPQLHPEWPHYYTPERLENSVLSTLLYRAIRSSFSPEASAASDTPPASASAGEAAARGWRRAAAILSTAAGPYDATSDSLQDVEPTVAVIKPLNAPDRTTVVATKYQSPNSGDPQNWVTTTNSVTSPGAYTRQQLPRVVDQYLAQHFYEGDPELAENPYNSNIGPLRTYCSVLGFDAPNVESGSTAVGVAFNDAGSSSWGSPYAVELSETPGVVLDRPSIAVSWHNGFDLGYVYVVYSVFDNNAGTSKVRVAQSRDAGVSFTFVADVASGGPSSQAPGTLPTAVAAPQVVVSSLDGSVGVFWVDYATNTIQAAFANVSTSGLNFWLTERVGSAPAGFVMSEAYVGGGNSGTSIKAESAPRVAFNRGNGTWNVVWHDSAATSPFTAHVEYAYRDGTGWHQVANVTQNSQGAHQYLPTVDSLTNSDVVLSYYQQSSSGGPLYYYHPWATYISYDGTRRFPLTSGDLQLDTGLAVSNTNFAGDYHDIWTWTFSGVEQSTAAWCGAPHGLATSEIYLSVLNQ